MVMASQTFMTDMQAINQSSQGGGQPQQQATVVTVATGNPNQPKSQMASQAFVTDMQTITQAQANQGGLQQQQPTVVTVATGNSIQRKPQNSQTTIIQPAQGGQQFIVTIADPGEGNVSDSVQLQQSSQVVYPAHAQYVEGSDTPIYTFSNGQTQGYTDYNQSSMYTPTSGTYYQPGNQGSPVSFEVQWLIDNYETAEGVSLPRSTLYNHYLHHCSEHKMDPMNPASFGNLIRSVFLGLRTRRLGTRGNSKYHYYGIRIKATSVLNQFTDDQTMAMRQQPSNPGKRFKTSNLRSENGDLQDGSSNSAQDANSQHQQFLGDASGALPNFGIIEMDENNLPDGLTSDHLRAFEQLYKEHSEAILDVVVNLQFSLIEALWLAFWRNTSDPQNLALLIDFSEDPQAEIRLPKDRLYSMGLLEPVQQYVRRSDFAFYQALVEVLIPDVLRPIPSSLTQAIRNFAKSLEGWLKNSMFGVPDEMLRVKLGAVGAFAQTLRRYTSLNHLAQAARAVLQNTSQISQMLTDLNRVDFANEQASWVCQCDDTVVHQLEQDFKKTLQQQNTLEEWAVWLEGVVNQVLKPHEGSPSFPKAARQFLLKWSFYSSMVIRDLTLRSAASFGSFHLIRLLYDEYMFYLIEHKVAIATGETPIAVMGEFIDIGAGMTFGSMDHDSDNSQSGLSKGESAEGAQHVLTKVERSPSLPASSASMTFAINHAAQANSPHNGTLTLNPSMASGIMNPAMTNTTVALVTSNSGTQGGTKTIVVVPVSAAAAGGDTPAVKRLKTL